MTSNFDYIIVGAGSAGCALANRLSANPSTRVLLLEAGPRDRSPWIHVPIGYYKNMTNPRYNWNYETEPVPGAANRRISWPRGKTLGGSSSINGLVYTRGQREDYDHWRQLGNTGWSYEDVLPYFRMAQGQERGEDEFHGANGPLGVSDVHHDELCDAYISAAEQAGHPRNEDFNGATQEGVGYFQLTTRNGLRCSSAVAYLHPIRKRPNLVVVTEALASRLLFEGQRCVGVRYDQRGNAQEAKANVEVVLCGGAINSPQLLQLSGVGPERLLRSLGIDIVHASEGVGQELQDHYQSRFTYECTRPITVNDEVRNPLLKARAGIEWLLKRTGPLALGAGHVGLFGRTRAELASPDVQIHFIRFSADSAETGLHKFSGFTVSVCQLRPESRGTIDIRSTDPREHPVIQPNYLVAEFDRQTMVGGMKLARRIMEQPAIAGYVKQEIKPGADVDTDEQLLEYVRNMGTTIFHPTSTCRMGPDDRAVVDERLRVRGIGGLRVADASIMPTVVSANTNAACIMIGERCAAMMIEDQAA